MIAIMGTLFMGSASATVTSGCYGQIKNRTFGDISLASPLRIRENETLHVTAGSQLPARLYVVRMYYFGIRYAIRGGTTNNSRWQADFNASQIFTRGAGNYIVEGFLANDPQTAVCVARLYIRVNGDPLGGPVGQGAGAVTVTGLIGMIATAVTGGKTPPGFESTTTPEEEEKIKQHQEEEKKDPDEDERKEAEWRAKTEGTCWFLVLPALLMTAGMMASGGGVSTMGAASPRRVRWRPRLSFVGIGSGVLFAVGSGVLLQQYGLIWPTLGMGIAFLVGGVALGILVPTLARLRVVRKLNKAFADFEARYETAAWSATHHLPDGGLQAWDEPDPSTEAREGVPGGLEVRVAQVRGDWAQVVAENGWWGWVDARQLETIPAKRSGRSITKSTEAAPVEEVEASAAPTGEEAIPADWYPDPSGEARLRYWDGTAWTSNTAD